MAYAALTLVRDFFRDLMSRNTPERLILFWMVVFDLIAKRLKTLSLLATPAGIEPATNSLEGCWLECFSPYDFNALPDAAVAIRGFFRDCATASIASRTSSTSAST